MKNLKIVLMFALVGVIYAYHLDKTEHDAGNTHNRIQKYEENGEKSNGLSSVQYRWPQNTVVYYFQPGDFTNSQMQTIKNGMRKISSLSCIEFRKRTPRDRNYVVIQAGKGCSSEVGYQHAEQNLRLHPYFCLNDGGILHELLHTLGFHHMQSHPDRNNYIKINWQNIEEENKHNFDILEETEAEDFNTGYDYSSIMHYSRTAFSKNGLPTIEPLYGKPQIGNKQKLSEGDLHRLLAMYKCLSDDNGNNLIGDNGNNLIGDNGNDLIDDNGNDLIDDNGNDLIDNNGYDLIDDNGNDLIDDNGNDLIGDNGNDLIDDNANNLIEGYFNHLHRFNPSMSKIFPRRKFDLIDDKTNNFIDDNDNNLIEDYFNHLHRFNPSMSKIFPRRKFDLIDDKTNNFIDDNDNNLIDEDANNFRRFNPYLSKFFPRRKFDLIDDSGNDLIDDDANNFRRFNPYMPKFFPRRKYDLIDDNTDNLIDDNPNNFLNFNPSMSKFPSRPKWVGSI